MTGNERTVTEQIDRLFLSRVDAMRTLRRVAGMPGELSENYLDVFDAQLGSRHLDFAARWLGKQGKGYYSIGSSGHEGNAAVAASTRPTDPALLHYRSAAFFLHRAGQAGVSSALRDVLLGVVASAEDPISGGRHKVFGSRELAVIPQTSTIASHLPRALGVAFSIARARKLGVECAWPEDAVVVGSFGDASANHSTATGAINAALHGAYQGIPIPLLFVCEDNGIGISVTTPSGWIRHSYGSRPGLQYFEADGCEISSALSVCAEAAEWVRARRRPAFLRLRTVRLMGHAGSDVESAYRNPSTILDDARQDPLVSTARLLVTSGVLTADEVLARYESKREQVMAVAEEVAGMPGLASPRHVMQPLRESSPEQATCGSEEPAEPRHRGVAGRSPEEERRLTLAESINRALTDVLSEYPEALVFGQDVADKGGVYGVTRGLAKRFGRARVFDTLLDEQSILGLGLGAATSGLLPIPEIQYLAYLHNAEDQLRGEGGSLRFFSDGQFSNPMVTRVAGYAYQKGFGGHFHNDNAVAVLRDIPGLVVASPSRPDDAADMLRALVVAARSRGTVSVFLEPIALYHTRDLHEPGDERWLAPYVGPQRWEDEETLAVHGRTHGHGSDLTIVTFGNGLYMSLRVTGRLARRGVHARVFDLRWLAPLPVADLMCAVEATGAVLIVDETRRSGGVSEAVLATLMDHDFQGRVARVTSEDSYIPLGAAAAHVLVSEAQIESAALTLLTLSRDR